MAGVEVSTSEGPISWEYTGKASRHAQQIVAFDHHIAEIDPNPAKPTTCCLYRKLNSTIMVVKATDDRLGCDAAYVLAGTMDWSVFAKRPMSPQLVIISGISCQDSA